MKRIFAQQGFGMIELLVVVALVGITLVGTVVFSGRSIRLRASSIREVEAALLLREGAEALRLVRDSGWATTSALALNTDYSLVWNDTYWGVGPLGAPLIADIFDRRFHFAPVYRDSNHRIVSSGGTSDPNSRLATVSVSYRSNGATTTREMSFLVINIF